MADCGCVVVIFGHVKEYITDLPFVVGGDVSSVRAYPALFRSGRDPFLGDAPIAMDKVDLQLLPPPFDTVKVVIIRRVERKL